MKYSFENLEVWQTLRKLVNIKQINQSTNKPINQ